jgi:hypothetical protein
MQIFNHFLMFLATEWKPNISIWWFWHFFFLTSGNWRPQASFFLNFWFLAKFHHLKKAPPNKRKRAIKSHLMMQVLGGPHFSHLTLHEE